MEVMAERTNISVSKWNFKSTNALEDTLTLGRSILMPWVPLPVPHAGITEGPGLEIPGCD